jgi:hypothetical protein
VSIPLSSFKSLNLDCKRILVAENKMNFLTLPDMPSAIALWSGGGFNVSYLENTDWLNSKQIYYWGDIDEHGFQILHQLRGYYPHTQSILMDMEVFLTFEQYAGNTQPATIGNLSMLNENELEVLKMLQSNPVKNRLEQERVSQEYVLEVFRKLTKQ